MKVVTHLMLLALEEGIELTAAALLILVYAACGFVAKFCFAMVSDRLDMRTLLFVSPAADARADRVVLSVAVEPP